MAIPITVFTGFLGAGKTSVILALLPKLPANYRVCLLKNEFGDVEVDSQLAKQSSLTAVNEILNGCMCCVLVGQMKNALLEIRDKYAPDRIIIETSGSAFPATLAIQIRDLERETAGDFKLDSIVTVIDAENFIGYEDTSPTAKLQASYTDVILINKWEHVSERALDIVLDHLNTLNDLTPKVRCNNRNGVDPDLIFGIDSTLFRSPFTVETDASHDEVQTVTIWKGGPTTERPHPSCGDPHCSHAHEHGPANVDENDEESDVVALLSADVLSKALAKLSKESVWRVKGFLRLSGSDGSLCILNWAFGRYDLNPFIPQSPKDAEGLVGYDVKLTIMGERGEVPRAAKRFAAELGAQYK